MTDDQTEEQEDYNKSREWSRWIFGWLIRVHYDRAGWWITDMQGYRNNLALSYTIITDDTGQKARRITAWNLMFEWAHLNDVSYTEDSDNINPNE